MVKVSPSTYQYKSSYSEAYNSKTHKDMQSDIMVSSHGTCNNERSHCGMTAVYQTGLFSPLYPTCELKKRILRKVKNCFKDKIRFWYKNKYSQNRYDEIYVKVSGILTS